MYRYELFVPYPVGQPRRKTDRSAFALLRHLLNPTRRTATRSRSDTGIRIPLFGRVLLPARAATRALPQLWTASMNPTYSTRSADVSRFKAAIPALAASIETRFRAVANRSWQKDLVARVSVVPGEVMPAKALLLDAALLSADVVLNYDWIETVYKQGITRVDNCLTLAAERSRPAPQNPLILVADVTLLRIGTDHHGYGCDCADHGTAAFAGGYTGYATDLGGGVYKPAEVEGAVHDLIVKLHRNRIHNFDFPGCVYGSRQ